MISLRFNNICLKKRAPTIHEAETVGRLNQKFFGRRAAKQSDCRALNRVCFQKIV